MLEGGPTRTSSSCGWASVFHQWPGVCVDGHERCLHYETNQLSKNPNSTDTMAPPTESTPDKCIKKIYRLESLNLSEILYMVKYIQKSVLQFNLTEKPNSKPRWKTIQTQYTIAYPSWIEWTFTRLGSVEVDERNACGLLPRESQQHCQFKSQAMYFHYDIIEIDTFIFWNE